MPHSEVHTAHLEVAALHTPLAHSTSLLQPAPRPQSGAQEVQVPAVASHASLSQSLSAPHVASVPHRPQSGRARTA
jgi:hypothetical protein